MDGLKSLLKSRKVWLVIIGFVAKFVGQKYGISVEEANQMLYGAVSLAAMVMAEDVAKKWKAEEVNEKTADSK